MAPLKNAYGNSGKSLAPPVPQSGQEAVEQMADFTPKGQAAVPAPQGDAADALLAELDGADQLLADLDSDVAAPQPITAESLMQGESNLRQEAGQAAGQLLDLPGSIMRTSLAEGASRITGQEDLVTKEDIANSIRGKGPKSAEYLERMGVGEHGSIRIPKIGTVTGRDVEGFALDILTDPLNAISGLIKKAPYIGKLLGAPGIVSETVGQAVYKSGLKKIDAKLVEKGEQAVSPLLIAEGKAGSTAQLAKATDEMAETMGNIRAGLYQEADKLGVQVDLSKLKRSEAVIAKMRQNPGLAPAADELENLMKQYQGAAGKVPIQLVSDWKTALYDTLPASAFDQHGKLKGQALKFKQALAADFREAIVRDAEKAQKGLGVAIDQTNEKWGTLINAKKPMAQQVKQAKSMSLGNSIDAMILGAGSVGISPETAIAALGVKKGVEVANTTYLRTHLGKKLMQAGQVGLVDSMARRAFIDSQREEIKPPLRPKGK
jgi:hypothetical protein